MPTVTVSLRRAVTVALLAGAGLAARWAPDSALRVAAGALLLLVLPGWGLQRAGAAHGLASPTLRLAIACLAPWAIHGVVATLLATAHFAFYVPALLTAALGVAAGLWFGDRGPSAPAGSPAAERAERWLVAAAVVVSAWYAAAPAELGLRSDIYAHVAAVRACLEEGRVFPVHEFHAPAQCQPAVDPRFGTGHALFAAWAWIARVEPVRLWQLASGPLALVWCSAVAALCAASTPAGFGRWIAYVLFVGCYGGRFLDPQRAAAYPLWLGMAAALAGAAVLLRSGGRPGRLQWWTIACLLAGAGAMHAMAFALGVVVLCAAVVVDGRLRQDRGRALLPMIVLVVPVMGLRYVLSYANANPIHQMPWYPLQWRPGLVSASPVFLVAWLFPMGLLAVPLAVGAWRREAHAAAARWAVLLLCGSLAWICIPWLLTPSIRLLGFLPMRLIMAALFPIVWAWWAHPSPAAAGSGRLRTAVAALALAYGLTGVASRASAVRAAPVDAFVQRPEWPALVQALRSGAGRPEIVLSDPYTMLALRACAPVYVVAVPEGRSSPADAQALQRLRDSWWGMSPAATGSATDSVLQRHGVTHVVVNQAFRADLFGFEYAIDQETLAEQRAKFESNAQRFRRVFEAGPFSLFEVVPGQSTADADYRRQCSEALPLLAEAPRALHDGFVLLDGSVQPAEPERDQPATAVALLGWTGSTLPPYRDIVIRADAVDDPVPAGLVWCSKPVRRVLEAVRHRRYRWHWQTVPAGGRCPTFTLGPLRTLRVEFPLVPPRKLAPGTYNVTIQVVRNAEFVVLSPRDLLRDDDVYTGPTLGRWEVE